jgi:hypothetical protein
MGKDGGNDNRGQRLVQNRSITRRSGMCFAVCHALTWGGLFPIDRATRTVAVLLDGCHPSLAQAEPIRGTGRKRGLMS